MRCSAVFVCWSSTRGRTSLQTGSTNFVARSCRAWRGGSTWMLCVCTSGPLHQFSSPSSPSPRMHCWDISSQLPRLAYHLFGSVLWILICLCLAACLPACLPACLSVCLFVCLCLSVCLSFCLVGFVLLSHPYTTAMVDYRYTKTVSFPVLLSVCTCLPLFLSAWLCPFVCLALSFCLSVPACLFICLVLSLSICACLSFHLSGSVHVSVFLSVWFCPCLPVPLWLFICLALSFCLSNFSVWLCHFVCLSTHLVISVSPSSHPSTWLRRRVHGWFDNMQDSGQSSATHSYQCGQDVLVSKQWYGFHSLGFLTCTQMLTHAAAQEGCANTTDVCNWMVFMMLSLDFFVSLLIWFWLIKSLVKKESFFLERSSPVCLCSWCSSLHWMLSPGSSMAWWNHGCRWSASRISVPWGNWTSASTTHLRVSLHSVWIGFQLFHGWFGPSWFVCPRCSVLRRCSNP